MDAAIQRLPRELGQEIFSYLLPDTKNIVFMKPVKRCFHDYCNHRYEHAYINEESCENPQGYYLSRIPKKNGKHRYYITKEIEDVMEVESNERFYNMFMYDYESKYVGKDLVKAIIALFYTFAPLRR